MFAAYSVVLGASLILALFRGEAFRLACVLIGSWAAKVLIYGVGLQVLTPYIDVGAFYLLLLAALKKPTRGNIVCVWLGVGMVAVHAVFNGTSVFMNDWAVANAWAIAYMWSLNAVFLLSVWSLLGGDYVRSIVGAALAWVGRFNRSGSGRGYAHPSLARQKVEP